MSTITNLGAALALSNVIQLPAAAGLYSWMMFRDNDLGGKNVFLATSLDGITWEKSEIEGKGIGFDLKTDNRAQLVVIGTMVYLFWIDSDRNCLMASRCTPDTVNPQDSKWAAGVTCQNSGGGAIEERGDHSTSCMSAVASGGRIIVTVNHDQRIDYYLFDPATWLPSWRAARNHGISPGQVPGLSGDNAVKNFGTNLSTVLYPASDGRAWLVQAIVAEDEEGRFNGRYRMLILRTPLEASESWFWFYGQGLPTQAAWLGDEKCNFVTLSLDPASRIIATYHNGPKVCYRTLPTATPDAAWSAESVVADARYAIDLGHPVSSFVYGEPVEIANPPVGFAQRESTVTQRVYYQATGSTSGQSYPRVFVAEVARGKMRQIYRAEEYNVTEAGSTGTIYLQGYIDGPPPVFDGMPNASSVVTYAQTSSKEFSKELATNVTVGMKTEGDSAPAVGAGLKWEGSFSVGAGLAFGAETSKSVSAATALQLETLDNRFLSQGLLLGSDIILCRDAYEYLENGTTPVANGLIYTSIYMSFRNNRKIQYDLGTVQVGRLEDYTRAAWNARMAPLYGNRDYLLDVVMPKAVQIGDKKFLRDTWTSGSPSNISFASTHSEYRSSSLTLDASLFAGASGKFFGADASFMAGFEVSVQATEKSAESESFGVSVSIDGSAGGSVKSYIVQTYLLQASNDWVREFIHFQGGELDGKRLDPASKCWKIMYLVEEIQYVDPIAALGLPAADLQALQELGVADTDGMLALLGLDAPAQLRDAIPPAAADQRRWLDALRAWDLRRNVYARLHDQPGERRPPARRPRAEAVPA